MPNTKILAAVIVPALTFGTFKLWRAAENSLDSYKAPSAGEVAKVAAVAADSHAEDALKLAAAEPAPVFKTPAPIALAADSVPAAASPLVEPDLPPIASGPQSIPAPRPAIIPTEDDIKVATTAAAKIAKADIKFQNTDILTASEQGTVQQTILGNGRDRTVITLRNNSPTPLRVGIPAGQILESGRNTVLVARPAEAELMPAQSLEVRLVTVALYSSNKVSDSAYKLSYQAAPKLESFLTWVAHHPEVSTPALQTAVLALTENLPLNALAKFAPSNGIASKLATDAFRVETADLIGALSALRKSGMKLDNIAMSLDPQLKIESMIEPLSREAAKRFYGITEEHEWDFWKRELLQGDPGTRHYALFGIARFYPEIAIDMLPKWVRETKTHPVYRMSAVQALADTQRPEALPILHALAEELGATNELGKAAAQAATYLDTRLAQAARNNPAVAFRGKKSVGGL
jgi:hypothetical protein